MSRKPFRLAILLSVFALFCFSQVGYADEGTATWYGPGFQGNRMANGQVYDMYDPTTTAANWWPFGTWIKVTNPANGKSVTVQVRDRGGFTHALDLSYAAFALLDDPNKMQIRVVYEVVPGPDSPPPAPTASPSPTPSPAPQPAPSARPAPAQAPAPARPPAAPAPAQKDPGPPPADYTVQPGDTLSKIAARYRLDPRVLITINGLDNPNSIVPGQHLKLKDTPRPAESSRGTAGPDTAHTITAGADYVIQPGDTTDSIASQLGMDGDTLASINGIQNKDLITVGQRIHTAPDATSTAPTIAQTDRSSYTVAPGDTLSSIAANYGVSDDAIARLNGISDPNSITTGQELQIPSSASASGNKAAQPAPKQYSIKPGETLSDVAAAYNVSVADLATANNLSDPSLVQPGQVLTIP